MNTRNKNLGIPGNGGQYASRELAESDIGTLQAPAPTRRELRAQKRSIELQLAALDINDLASQIRKIRPTATSFAAVVTHEDYEDQEQVRFYNIEGKPVGTEDPMDLGGAFDNVELVPREWPDTRSPLGRCATESSEPNIRHYDLAKMAALTAEDLS